MADYKCSTWWLMAMIVWTAMHVGKAVAAEHVTVDLQLVLAVDISLSMDEDEQRLQRDGYVAAFHDPEIIQSIKTGANGRIVVTYVEWSGENYQRIVIPWTLIDGPETAFKFADRLATVPLETNYRTSISGALLFASRLFDDNGYQGRETIDISGDGANNQGIPVEEARDAAVRRGISINGLPLLLKSGSMDSYFEMLQLDQYYQQCVIGGTGAFIVPVRHVSEFIPAIRRKLILEIASRDLPIVRIAESSPRSRADCLIGEKLWKQWMERIQ